MAILEPYFTRVMVRGAVRTCISAHEAGGGRPVPQRIRDLIFRLAYAEFGGKPTKGLREEFATRLHQALKPWGS